MGGDDLIGVFVVVQEIQEIGARAGDRILLRPWAPRPVLLQRELGHSDAAWAFGSHAELLFTRPTLPVRLALRLLRDRLRPQPRRRHLRLM